MTGNQLRRRYRRWRSIKHRVPGSDEEDVVWLPKLTTAETGLILGPTAHTELTSAANGKFRRGKHEPIRANSSRLKQDDDAKSTATSNEKLKTLRVLCDLLDLC